LADKYNFILIVDNTIWNFADTALLSTGIALLRVLSEYRIATSSFEVYSYSKSESLPMDNVLTNRDMIFIKECILGKPLKSYDKFIGRDLSKAYLYDIVNNRHNGLDVDKIDYFARDLHYSQGSSIIKKLMVLIHEAYVAKVECDPHRGICHLGGHCEHLMICYPEKILTSVIDFFRTRFTLFTEIYTHMAAKGFEFLLRDILVKANQYFRLKIDCSISEAIYNAETFLLLKDSIIDVIYNSPDPLLTEAQDLISRFNGRDAYKQICLKRLDEEGEEILSGLSEESMKQGLLRAARHYDAETSFDYTSFIMNDLIIELRKIHHGMKRENPTNFCRFIPKYKTVPFAVKSIDDLPVAEKMDEAKYASHLPRIFQEVSLIAFSRCSDGDSEMATKHEFTRHLIEQWLELERSQRPNTTLPDENNLFAAFACTQNSDDDLSIYADDKSYIEFR